MSSIINSQDEINLFEVFNLLVKHIKMIMRLTFVFTFIIYVIASNFMPEKSFETTFSYTSNQLGNVMPNTNDLFLSKKQLERFLAKPVVRAAVFPSQWNDKKQQWVKKEKDLNHPEGIPTIIDLQHFLKKHINFGRDQVIIKWQTKKQYDVSKAYFDEYLNKTLISNQKMLRSVKDKNSQDEVRLASLNNFKNDPIIETRVIDVSKLTVLFTSIMLALVLSIFFIIGREAFTVARSKRV